MEGVKERRERERERERECVSREGEVLSNIERQHKQAAAQAGSSERECVSIERVYGVKEFIEKEK